MDPEQELLELKAYLKPLVALMGKAADTILDEGVSKYPIFIIHQKELGIGLPLVQNEPPDFSVNASTLEEFATKGLIEADKVDNFRKIYKDPEQHICVLAANTGGATFIFIPRT